MAATVDAVFPGVGIRSAPQSLATIIVRHCGGFVDAVNHFRNTGPPIVHAGFKRNPPIIVRQYSSIDIR